MSPLDQMLDALGVALEGSLDPAVRQVAHPTGDAPLSGDAAARVAEEDALHIAGDKYPPTDHRATVPPPCPTRTEPRPRAVAGQPEAMWAGTSGCGSASGRRWSARHSTPAISSATATAAAAALTATITATWLSPEAASTT
jgi:hypothetical protein